MNLGELLFAFLRNGNAECFERNRSGKGFVPFGGRNFVPSTEKMPRAGMFRPKVKSANETGKKFDYRNEDHLFSKCFSLWR